MGPAPAPGMEDEDLILAVLKVTPAGLVVLQIAEGLRFEELQAVTDAPLLKNEKKEITSCH